MNQPKRASIVAAAITLSVFSLADAAEFVTPTAGGTGGDHSYNLDCGADGVLVGLSGRWGGWMDSVGIICRKVNADGTLGSSFALGPKGGNGGSEAGNVSCEPANVVQRLRPDTGSYVNDVSFACGAWSSSSRTVERPAFDSDTDNKRVGASGMHLGSRSSVLECPTDGKPATGIRGKYGSYVDSIALVCDSVTTVTAGGTGKTGGPGTSTPAQLPSLPENVIRFDEAPAAGAVVSLSASRGGDIVIRASGGTTALSMTLSVTDGTYRPFFDLVSPPLPPPPAMTSSLTATAKPGASPAIGAQAAPPQTAPITRIVRMRPGAPLMTGFTPPAIMLVVTVRSANGTASARAFAVRLLP